MKLKLIKNRLWTRGDIFAGLVILVIFTAMSLSVLTIAQASQISLFEYILFAMADHYYLIYAWLFFLVFVSGKDVRNQANLEIIRYGSFSSYNSITLITVAVKLAILIAVHVLIAGIIASFSLEPVNVFTINEASGYYDFNLEVLAGYQQYFANPLSAIAAEASYLWLGSLFIYALIFVGYQYKGNKGMLASCVVIIISTILGFVTQLDESPLEVLFGNNYYILNSPLLSVSPLAVVVNLVIMVMCILLAVLDLPRKAGKKKHRRLSTSRKNRSGFFSPAIARGLVSLYLILLIALGIFPQLTSGGNLVTFVWSVLKGYSAENFNLIESLYYLAWFAFPLIQINVFWQNENERKNDAALIRTDGYRQWRHLTDEGCKRFIVRYWFSYLALFAMTIALLSFFYYPGGDSLAEYCGYFNVTETVFLTVLIATVLLKLPELLLLYELSLIIYNSSKNTILSFLGPFLGYAAGLIVPLNWWPFGISTAYSLFGLSSSGLSGCLAAGLALTGMLAVLNLCNKKRRKIR